MISYSIKTFLNAGMHIGHNASICNPNMKPYIYGVRQRISLINLEQTYLLLKRALLFLKYSNITPYSILIVNANPKLNEVTINLGKECKQWYINTWIPGILTNNQSILPKLNLLSKLTTKIKDNKALSKKELNKYTKLNKYLSGLLKHNNTVTSITPNIIIIFNPESNEGKMVLNEANKMLIPVIGLVDSNANPKFITYPVPGNNDSIGSVGLIADLIRITILNQINKNT